MVAGLLLLDPGLALPSGAPVADLPASTDARACGLGNCRHSPLHTPCCLWLVADWAASVASGQRQHRVSGSGGATVLSYTRLVCGCVRVGHFIASRLPKVSDGRHTDKGTDKGTSWSCRCRQAPLPPRRAAISCSYMVLLGAGAAWCLLWTCCFVCLLLYPLLLVHCFHNPVACAPHLPRACRALLPLPLPTGRLSNLNPYAVVVMSTDTFPPRTFPPTPLPALPFPTGLWPSTCSWSTSLPWVRSP